MKYDYLVVGSGLFGSVFAQKAFSAGKSVLVIDIMLFYLSILVSQLVGYKKIKSKKVSVRTEEVNKYLVILIVITFILFTFCPPKLDIFKDEITSTYGAFELKY